PQPAQPPVSRRLRPGPGERHRHHRRPAQCREVDPLQPADRAAARHRRRDRLYWVAEWRGRRFTLVDTAGLDPALISEDPGIAELTRGTQQQARIAIQEADLCILMVDVRAGVTGLDEDVA